MNWSQWSSDPNTSFSITTGKYLNSTGGWQSTQTWAMSVTDTSITGGGQAGLARPVVPEYLETNYFDDFTTAVGVDAQDFDATPVNTLPTGWQQWSSDGKANYFTVAAAPDSSHFLSANNVLESTGGSAVTTQTWDTNENSSWEELACLADEVAELFPSLSRHDSVDPSSAN